MLEQRLDNQNYDSLTKSTYRKDDVLITDATVDTDTSNDIINDNDNDSDNNRSNERIDHGIQTTYGDRNGLQIINDCDDEESNQITLATKKPIYNS